MELKLTAEERAFAELLGGVGAKLLRIHDEQAAVLERVLAYERGEAWDADGCVMSLGEILAALSPSPAPEKPLGVRDFPASEYLFPEPAPAQAAEPDDHRICAMANEIATAAQVKAEARAAELEHAVNNECSLRVQATDAAYTLQSRADEAVKILEGMYGETRLRVIEVLRGK